MDITKKADVHFLICIVYTNINHNCLQKHLRYNLQTQGIIT